MKTMDCWTLGSLLENREPMDLIDIRSRKDFSAMHIPGARSFPFAQLASPKIFQRRSPTEKPIYVVSDCRGKASLATGILRASGYLNAIVVDGGMKAWLSQGLPVQGKQFTLRMPSLLRAGSIVLGIVALPTLVLSKILIGALLLVSALGLLAKAYLMERDPVRQTPRLDWATT